MHIIRALWGNDPKIQSEIPKSPLFDNETVFVWGECNQRFLESLGYRTLLMGYDLFYKEFIKHFTHKIDVIIKADEMFDEYLFLDWDVKVIKPLDSNFYELIRKGPQIQCPVYHYEFDYLETSLYKIQNSNADKTLLIPFVQEIYKGLQKYGWKEENYFVLPCFCFYYSNNVKLGKNLLNIINKYNIVTNVEEFSLKYYLLDTLEEYIKKHHPLVIKGSEILPESLLKEIYNLEGFETYLEHNT